MTKPIKCPSCNKNMYILSNAISGEGGELYSAKMECGMCNTRFCHVVHVNEEAARRMTAKLTRAWIAKLKTCHKAGECALQTYEAYEAIGALPRPPRAPGSGGRGLIMPQGVYTYAAPNGDLGCTPVYSSGFPEVVTMYMASGLSVTYSSDATVTTTSKISVDELMSLRSQGLLSDTKKEDPNEVP